jgi:ubiquinone/menaquinone biosynthesis C-methylase UbiE
LSLQPDYFHHMGFQPALRLLAVLACLVSGAAVPLSYAQGPAVPADITRHFANPVFEQWVGRFERPGREIYDRRHWIVEASAVQPGMVVADIGAGTGLFTRLFADKVGASGKVYAVDISRVFIDNILRLSAELNQDNVTGVVNAADDVGLPPQSIDLAFICDTYHHFEYPQAMMASIRRALKPGGSVVVIDFRKIPGFSTPWVMGHVRANESTVVREMESYGFRLVEDRDFLRSNYFLRFVPA